MQKVRCEYTMVWDGASPQPENPQDAYDGKDVESSDFKQEIIAHQEIEKSIQSTSCGMKKEYKRISLTVSMEEKSQTLIVFTVCSTS